MTQHDPRIIKILKQANYLIDGKYIEKLRDTTLPLRGSSNQEIIALDELTTAAKKKAEIEYMDERYNPENIQKKLKVRL